MQNRLLLIYLEGIGTGMVAVDLTISLRNITVGRTLHPVDSLGGFDIVVSYRNSGRRTGVVTDSGAGNDDRALHALGVVCGIIVIHLGSIGNSPVRSDPAEGASGECADLKVLFL